MLLCVLGSKTKKKTILICLTDSAHNTEWNNPR